jgi:hypothetical protein
LFLSKALSPIAALSVAGFGLAALPPGGARAQNLVQNPGFEETVDQGGGSAISSPDWTVTPFNGTLFVSGGGHTGNWFALFEASSPDEALAGTLSQTIATVPMTTYLVSFFLESTSQTPNNFTAQFGGETILSLVDAPSNGYQQYSATVTALSASTTLSFVGEHDGAQWVLDDISVEAEGAPTPLVGGGISSFVVAMASFAFWQRRRRFTGTVPPPPQPAPD